MKKMTSKERLLAAINHEEPDYVPVNPRIQAWLMGEYGEYNEIWGMHYIAKKYDSDPIYTKGLEITDYISGSVGSYTEFKDVEVETKIGREKDLTRITRVINTPAGKLQDVKIYVPRGGIYGVSPNPEVIEPLIKTSEDLDRMRYLLVDSDKVVRNIQMIETEIGDSGLLQIMPLSGTLSHVICQAIGITNIMILYYENKALVDKAIRILQEYHKKYLKKALEGGARMIFGSWYDASLSAGWSPAMWREMFKPCIREDVELTHSFGAKYHFYDDGKIMPLLDDLLELEVDMFSTLCPPPAGDTDFKKIKEKIGGKVCLNGGVDLQNILRKTPKEIDKEVKELMEIMAPGGGFLLGTSDSIRDESPEQNVAAFFKAGRKYGKYN